MNRIIDKRAILNNLELAARRLKAGDTQGCAQFLAQDLIALLGPSRAQELVAREAEDLKEIFCYQEH